mgnify:CR=1 FL=1
MKMIISWALIILLAYTAQTSLFTLIDFHGVSVNLMLLFIVSVAYIHGWKKGLGLGFLTGLLQDFTTGSFFGCATFTYMTIGLLFGKFATRVFKEQFFFPVMSAPVAAIIYFAFMTILIYLLGYEIDVTRSMRTILLPLICYQLVFAWLIHKIVFDFDKFAKRHG